MTFLTYKKINNTCNFLNSGLGILPIKYNVVLVIDMWTFSKLSKENMDAIGAAEGKLGVTLIAFSEEGTKYAALSDDAIKEVKELEKKLGLSLVALETD